MATAAKCGSTGTVSEGTEITNWTFSVKEETPDATSMSSNGWHEHLGCLQYGEGTFESLVTCGAIGARNGAQFSNDVETITADIIITNVDVSVGVGDLIKFKYSFITTGEVN